MTGRDWTIKNREIEFLDASSHLYKRVCPSVHPLVHPSVRYASSIITQMTHRVARRPPGLVCSSRSRSLQFDCYQRKNMPSHCHKCVLSHPSTWTFHWHQYLIRCVIVETILRAGRKAYTLESGWSLGRHSNADRVATAEIADNFDIPSRLVAFC